MVDDDVVEVVVSESSDMKREINGTVPTVGVNGVREKARIGLVTRPIATKKMMNGRMVDDSLVIILYSGFLYWRWSVPFILWTKDGAETRRGDLAKQRPPNLV